METQNHLVVFAIGSLVHVFSIYANNFYYAPVLYWQTSHIWGNWSCIFFFWQPKLKQALNLLLIKTYCVWKYMRWSNINEIGCLEVINVKNNLCNYDIAILFHDLFPILALLISDLYWCFKDFYLHQTNINTVQNISPILCGSWAMQSHNQLKANKTIAWSWIQYNYFLQIVTNLIICWNWIIMAVTKFWQLCVMEYWFLSFSVFFSLKNEEN